MSPLEASATGDIFLAAALTLLIVCVTAAIHYEALRVLTRVWRGRHPQRGGLMSIFVGLMGAHLAEISLYAVAYALATHLLGLGVLEGAAHGALAYFCFAAENYLTLGYGDVVPGGALRLIASVETVNGLLLISWSGAFLFCVLCDQRGKAHLRHQ